MTSGQATLTPWRCGSLGRNESFSKVRLCNGAPRRPACQLAMETVSYENATGPLYEVPLRHRPVSRSPGPRRQHERRSYFEPARRMRRIISDFWNCSWTATIVNLMQ